jgi:hypothetical protein
VRQGRALPTLFQHDVQHVRQSGFHREGRVEGDALFDQLGEWRQGRAPTFLQRINSTKAIWNIECSTGKSYMITLKNTADVSVVGCDMLSRRKTGIVSSRLMTSAKYRGVCTRLPDRVVTVLLLIRRGRD